VAAAPPPAASTTTYTVVAGDSLWTIAATHLGATVAAGGVPSADEIAPYWRAVCDANRATLRSGDLNLIYPGEQVLVPPIG
jgi:nucleoid-associated protein YgaU